MRITAILLSGVDITNDVVGISNLTRSINDAWDIEGAELQLSVVDDAGTYLDWIRTLPEGQSIVCEVYDENGGVVLIGEIDPPQSEYDEATQNISLSVTDFFARAKSAVVQDETWKRGGDAIYTILEEASLGEDPTDYLDFDHVAELYPDDILVTEFDENGSKQTDRKKIVSVHPEFGRVYLESPPRRISPAGSQWTRSNHELRMLSVHDAIARLNVDIEVAGVISTLAPGLEGGFSGPGWIGVDGAAGEYQFVPQIEDNTGSVEFSDPVTSPYPVPRIEDQIGSVIIQCAYDANTIQAVFRGPGDTETERLMIRFGKDAPAIVVDWVWPGPGENAAPYPLDWVNHLSSPPAELVPPLSWRSMVGDSFSIIPQIYIRDATETGPNVIEGSQSEMSVMCIDYSIPQLWDWYKPEDTTTWQLRKWTWNGSTWSPTNVGSPRVVNWVHGIAFDHVTSTLYTVDPFRLRTVDQSTGAIGDVMALPIITGQSFGILSPERLMYALNRNGNVLYLWDIAAGYAQTDLHVDTGRINITTLIMFESSLYALSYGTAGTFLHRWTKVEGEWVEDLAEQLLPTAHQAGSTTKTTGILWISVGGQLFVHSTTYEPLFERADVFGMSVGDVARNCAFLADSIIAINPNGGVSITPKVTTPSPEATVTEWDEYKMAATWDAQYQRVNVNGRDDFSSASATTGIPGDTLEVECEFITLKSLARAIARMILEYHKYKRRPLSGSTDQVNGLLPLQAFTDNASGADFMLTSVVIFLNPEAPGVITSDDVVEIESIEQVVAV